MKRKINKTIKNKNNFYLISFLIIYISKSSLENFLKSFLTEGIYLKISYLNLGQEKSFSVSVWLSLQKNFSESFDFSLCTHRAHVGFEHPLIRILFTSGTFYHDLMKKSKIERAKTRNLCKKHL